MKNRKSSAPVGPQPTRPQPGQSIGPNYNSSLKSGSAESVNISASIGASFGAAVRRCLSNYATFDGRAQRQEFWWWVLFVFLLSLLGGLISESLANWIFVILLLPTLAVTSRRLHDTNRSGWFQLLSIVPFLGLVVLYFCLLPSKDPNKYS